MLFQKKQASTPGKAALSLDSFSPLSNHSPLLTDDKSGGAEKNPDDFLVQSSPEAEAAAKAPPVMAMAEAIKNMESDLSSSHLDIEEGPLTETPTKESVQTQNVMEKIVREDEEKPVCKDLKKAKSNIANVTRKPPLAASAKLTLSKPRSIQKDASKPKSRNPNNKTFSKSDAASEGRPSRNEDDAVSAVELMNFSSSGTTPTLSLIHI